MKKLLASLILVLSLCFVTPSYAYADEVTTVNEYYQVKADDVAVYSYTEATGMKPLFTLPNTYFVLKDTSRSATKFEGIIDLEPIKYQGYNTNLYIKKVDVVNNKLLTATKEQTNKLTEENAYLNKSIELKAEYGGFTVGTVFKFMGKNGENVVVLDNNNKLQSIPLSQFDEITYENHSFPEDNNSDVVVGGEALNPYNKLNTTLLIVGLTIASVVILVVIFFPKRKQPTREERYYEDDYYDNYRDRYDTRNR